MPVFLSYCKQLKIKVKFAKTQQYHYLCKDVSMFRAEKVDMIGKERARNGRSPTVLK